MVVLYHGSRTMVEPWYHSRFCRRTSIGLLVNLDKLLEVDEWLSKNGSKINNYLFNYTPYTALLLAYFNILLKAYMLC